MAYNLENKLVIGVASSAIFDLKKSQAYFRRTNEAAYRRYQEKHLDDPLPTGSAYQFVKRLLSLNDLRPDDPPVEVIVMSKNDPMTGLRVMRSLEHHKLPITRAIFSRGRPTHQYMARFSMSLFLSQERSDVVAAIRAGLPAGHVQPSAALYDENDPELRIAFDFDSVLSDDGSERHYKESGDIDVYRARESELRDVPLDPGPLAELLKDLNLLQELETTRARSHPGYKPRLRIALVTARNAPAHERAVRSLRSWGVTVDEAFFLGGVAKSTVLGEMRPHIFFDDQMGHLEGSTQHFAGVHVPFGIANEPPANFGEAQSTAGNV